MADRGRSSTAASKTARARREGATDQGCSSSCSARWHGIKQVIESAAIAAIQSGTERVTLPLLPAWREDLESLVCVTAMRRQPRRARA